MADERFVPLSRRSEPDLSLEWRDALADGIPAWLLQSVARIVHRYLSEHFDGPDHERLRRLERHLRINLEWSGGGHSARDDVLNRIAESSDEALDIVDYLLSAPNSRLIRQDLRVFLEEGGSAWAVVGEHLERRVDITTHASARALIEAGTRPSDHLATAWSAAFGRKLTLGHAFREAIRAVEAALILKVSPNDPSAALGQVIGEISANRGRYDVRLQPKPPLDAVEAFSDMLRLLWTSQYDRHSSGNEEEPLTVGQGEAEDAVTLAVTIVHWVESGAFESTTT